MLGAENDVGDIANAELDPVVSLQFLALHALPIHVGAVLASLIDNKEIAIFRHDKGVVA